MSKDRQPIGVEARHPGGDHAPERGQRTDPTSARRAPPQAPNQGDYPPQRNSTEQWCGDDQYRRAQVLRKWAYGKDGNSEENDRQINRNGGNRVKSCENRQGEANERGGQAGEENRRDNHPVPKRGECGEAGEETVHQPCQAKSGQPAFEARQVAADESVRNMQEGGQFYNSIRRSPKSGRV
jgi:hypothetical protein